MAVYEVLGPIRNRPTRIALSDSGAPGVSSPVRGDRPLPWGTLNIAGRFRFSGSCTHLVNRASFPGFPPFEGGCIFVVLRVKISIKRVIFAEFLPFHVVRAVPLFWGILMPIG